VTAQKGFRTGQTFAVECCGIGKAGTRWLAQDAERVHLVASPDNDRALWEFVHSDDGGPSPCGLRNVASGHWLCAGPEPRELVGASPGEPPAGSGWHILPQEARRVRAEIVRRGRHGGTIDEERKYYKIRAHLPVGGKRWLDGNTKSREVYLVDDTGAEANSGVWWYFQEVTAPADRGPRVRGSGFLAAIRKFAVSHSRSAIGSLLAASLTGAMAWAVLLVHHYLCPLAWVAKSAACLYPIAVTGSLAAAALVPLWLLGMVPGAAGWLQRHWRRLFLVLCALLVMLIVWSRGDDLQGVLLVAVSLLLGVLTGRWWRK